MTLAKSIENQSEHKSEHKSIGKTKLQESLSVFEETKSMKKDMKKYKNEVENLKKNLKKYEEEIASLKALKGDEKDDEEITKKKNRIKKLKEDLRKVLLENEELSGELVKTTSELDEQKKEVNILHEMLIEKEKYNDILEEESMDMEKRYEQEFKRKNELEKENQNMKAKIQTLLKENEDLTKFSEVMEKDENLKNQIKDLENEISILKYCLKTKDERYDISIKTAKELKEEVRQLKDENRKVKEENNRYLEENRQLNDKDSSVKVLGRPEDTKLISDLKKSIDNSNKHIDALKVAETELNKYNKLICEENKSLLEDKIYWLGMFQKFFKLFGKEEETIKEFYENVINSNCSSCKSKLTKEYENGNPEDKELFGYKSIDWSEKSLEALKNQYKGGHGKKNKGEPANKHTADRLKEYEDINLQLQKLGSVSNTILSYEEDSSSEISQDPYALLSPVYTIESTQTNQMQGKENNHQKEEAESDPRNFSRENMNNSDLIYKNHMETISLLKEILKNLKGTPEENTSEGIRKVNEAMKNFYKKLINKFQVIIGEQGRRLENIFTLKELSQNPSKQPTVNFSEVVYKKKYEDLFEIIIKIRGILESKNKKDRKLFSKEIHGHINKLKKLTNKNVVRLVTDLYSCVEFINETNKINDIVDSVFAESYD